MKQPLPLHLKILRYVGLAIGYLVWLAMLIAGLVLLVQGIFHKVMY